MMLLYDLILALTTVSLTIAVERGFVYCPAYPCSCESKDGALIINCMSLYLSALPKFLSFDGRIKELSLRFNNIRNLPAHSFQGLNIEKLDLLDNAVTMIHEDAFVGLEQSLKALSLQMYAYEGLPMKALSKLKELRSLHIIGCKQPELYDELFENLVSLESLYLIGCRISRIKTGAFTSLPKLKHLVLSGNAIGYDDLQEVNALQQLVVLDLSNNDIRHLQNQALSRLSKLRYLNLAFNKMTNIAAGAFYNLDYTLEEMNLHGNALKEDSLESIRHMKTIRYLDLSSNNISSLNEEDFMGLRYLASLNLANNAISGIKRRDLIGVGASLTNLELHGNPLERIESGAFSDFAKLESVNINGTLVGSKLHPDTFKGVKKTLKHLHASSSGMTSSHLVALSSLHHLTDLDLSFNAIEEVSFEAIGRWRHLSFANFSHNRITDFLSGPLANVNSTLKSVDLSWNQIQVLPECVFFLLKELTDVKLDENPLACNCSSSWLFRWKQLTHFGSKDRSSNWQCAPTKGSPRKSFSDLEFSDLKCANSSSEELRCLTKYLPWRTENVTTSAGELSVFTPPTSDKILYFNITHPNAASLHVRWVTRVSGLIGGYRVMLTRCNDSSVVESVTVSPDTSHYTFYPFDRNVQQELCVVMLAENLSTLETKCEGVSPILSVRDPRSKDPRMYAMVHNSFIPLLLIYISGSLALAFIIACLVLCVRKNLRRKPLRLDPFYPGYPAWMDQRSSISNLSVSPDHHLFLFEELGVPEHKDYHTQSTLISGRSSDHHLRRHHHPTLAREIPNVQLNRRNSRTPSVPSVVHLCPFECASLNSTMPKPVGSEILAGRAEINDEFYFHF